MEAVWVDPSQECTTPSSQTISVDGPYCLLIASVEEEFCREKCKRRDRIARNEWFDRTQTDWWWVPQSLSHSCIQELEMINTYMWRRDEYKKRPFKLKIIPWIRIWNDAMSNGSEKNCYINQKTLYERVSERVFLVKCNKIKQFQLYMTYRIDT